MGTGHGREPKDGVRPLLGTERQEADLTAR
jgi:hypothetical protein